MEASDPDPQDRLLFTVQYSHNSGAEWHTLTADYPSTPAGTYTLTYNDLGSLQGSAPNAARIRVLASDGYNTGIATSQPFTLKNRKPEPYIVAPSGGQTYPAGAAVVLQGGATDPEDGGLTGSSLTWALDGNNAGSGAEAIATGLAPGTHTDADDGDRCDKQHGERKRQFAVAPLTIPLGAAPLLDGTCDDSPYAAGTQVQLAPYSDGAQATVRLLRSGAQLWACFTGMQPGGSHPRRICRLARGYRQQPRTRWRRAATLASSSVKMGLSSPWRAMARAALLPPGRAACRPRSAPSPPPGAPSCASTRPPWAAGTTWWA